MKRVKMYISLIAISFYAPCTAGKITDWFHSKFNNKSEPKTSIKFSFEDKSKKIEPQDLDQLRQEYQELTKKFDEIGSKHFNNDQKAYFIMLAGMQCLSASEKFNGEKDGRSTAVYYECMNGVRKNFINQMSKVTVQEKNH